MNNSMKRVLSIDPSVWLASHGFTETDQSVGLAAISAGDDMIASCGGDVALALTEAPDLHAEIILAYVLSFSCLDNDAKVQLKEFSEIIGAYTLED